MMENHFRFCFKLFKFIGLRPLGRSVLPLVILNWVVTCFITSLAIINFIKHTETKYFESVLSIAQVFLKYGIALIYRKEIIRALGDVKHFLEINLQDSQNKTLATYFKAQKPYAIYLVVASSTLTIRPIILNGRSIFDSYVPEKIPFLVVYVLEFYTLCVGTTAYTALNILICMLILLAVGQFRILNEKLKELKLDEIKNEDDVKECVNKLKGYIRYHNFLLRYIRRINNVVSMPITIFLVFDITLLCLSMITLSSDIPVLRKCQAGLISFAIISEFFIMYGLPAQFLMDEALAVNDSLYYHSRWYLPDVIPVRKHMLMVMVRSQYPASLSAEGFININNRTVLFVLKTAYTFYTFLHTVT